LYYNGFAVTLSGLEGFPMGIVILSLILVSLIATAFALNSSASLPLWLQLVFAFVPQVLMFSAGFVLDRWEPAQLLWHHFLGSLSNRISVWSFIAEYKPKDSKKALTEVLEIILRSNQSELWQDTPTQKVIHTPIFTVRLYLSPTGTNDTSLSERDILYCKLTDMHIPYRQSRRILMREILPLFEEIEQKLAVDSPIYEMRIAFEQGKNPYYGFFVKRVPNKMMRDFELEFDIPVRGENHAITVGKDNISIVAKRVLPLTELAMHYLSFSSSPVPDTSTSSLSA